LSAAAAWAIERYLETPKGAARLPADLRRRIARMTPAATD